MNIEYSIIKNRSAKSGPYLVNVVIEPFLSLLK